MFYCFCVSLSIGCKTSITAEIWIPPVDAEPDAFIKIGIAECCAFIIALTYYYLYKAGSKLRNPYAGDPGDDLNLPRFGAELNMDISLILQPKYQELCEINYGKTQIHRPNWLLPWSLGTMFPMAEEPPKRYVDYHDHGQGRQNHKTVFFSVWWFSCLTMIFGGTSILRCSKICLHVFSLVAYTG